MALKTCINTVCPSAFLLIPLDCRSQGKTGPCRLFGQVCYLQRVVGKVSTGTRGFPPDDSMAGDALPAS